MEEYARTEGKLDELNSLFEPVTGPRYGANDDQFYQLFKLQDLRKDGGFTSFYATLSDRHNHIYSSICAYTYDGDLASSFSCTGMWIVSLDLLRKLAAMYNHSRYLNLTEDTVKNFIAAEKAVKQLGSEILHLRSRPSRMSRLSLYMEGEYLFAASDDIGGLYILFSDDQNCFVVLEIRKNENTVNEIHVDTISEACEEAKKSLLTLLTVYQSSSGAGAKYLLKK